MFGREREPGHQFSPAVRRLGRLLEENTTKVPFADPQNAYNTLNRFPHEFLRRSPPAYCHCARPVLDPEFIMLDELTSVDDVLTNPQTAYTQRLVRAALEIAA